LLVSGWKKLDLNLRPHGQVCQGKDAHAYVAEIDSEGIHVKRTVEYLHGSVKQLAFSTTPIWFKSTLENHPLLVRTK
jgi:hypothetical protein